MTLGISPHDEMLASSQARASRLKRMRRLTFMSRKEFAKKHAFSPGTLQNWVTARFGGLTEKGARLILKAFKAEGIFCTYEWLMLGVGDGPVFAKHNDAPGLLVGGREHVEQKRPGIAQEMKFFLQLHHGAICAQMKDDSLQPYVDKGDWLGGVACNIARQAEIQGRLCIVEFEDGVRMVRYIKQISANGSVVFVSANPFSDAQNLHGCSQVIKKIAPVVWRRKVEVDIK